MPDFNEEIVKLELWYNDVFLPDDQIKKYVEITAKIEKQIGVVYTMEALKSDIDCYILDTLEIISGISVYDNR